MGGEDMKKIISLTMVLIFVLSITMNIALAEEESIIIYANVPSDWEEPCIWAWGEDGTGVYDAWPGEKLIEDSDNEGWYYIHVPSWVTAVIINANEGGVQTSDFSTNGENSWITIKSPEEATLVNEMQTTGDLPEEVKMITVNAYVPEDWVMPNLWAWSAPDGTNAFPNWPGQELESHVDGWYSYQVPGWVNSVIVNANLGEIQTSDISIESNDVWLVVEDKDTVVVSYEKPVIEVETIKVHAKVPEDWILPSLWAWSAPDGTNVFPNWPGHELDEDGEWNTYSIPNWVNSIIINGNLGAVQTSDISIEPNDLWVVVTGPDAYEVYYEEPEITTEAVEDTSETTEAVEDEEVPMDEPEKDSNVLIIMGGIVALLAIGVVATTRKKK